VHIAAHACSERLTLVTNSLAEFERVPGLPTENWAGSAGWRDEQAGARRFD